MVRRNSVCFAEPLLMCPYVDAIQGHSMKEVI